MRAAGCLLLLGCVAPGPQWTPLLPEDGFGSFEPTVFGGEGGVRVCNGVLELDAGSPLTGVTWTGAFPRSGYELRLEAACLQGNDFFCGLTFPVGEDHLTLVLGGWGGALVGLSCIDGKDASANLSRSFRRFETGRFYAVRIRVTGESVAAWVDGEVVAEIDPRSHRLSLRAEVVPCAPLGICSYATDAALRSLEYRMLPTTR